MRVNRMDKVYLIKIYLIGFLFIFGSGFIATSIVKGYLAEGQEYRRICINNGYDDAIFEQSSIASSGNLYYCINYKNGIIKDKVQLKEIDYKVDYNKMDCDESTKGFDDLMFTGLCK